MGTPHRDMLDHFNNPGPALEAWCQEHLTPDDYVWISSCKGLEVFRQSFPYCARAIKHQVKNNPHWWDEWSHPNFAHDMLKYSQDPQWVELLRFHWDERAARPMRNPHTDLPFPKHNPSPPKLSSEPCLPIGLLDAQNKNNHHWIRVIEYSLEDMSMFSALMNEVVLRQVYQHSISMENLTLRPQAQDALAILACHQDAPISAWQKVLNSALCINHAPIINWLHTSSNMKLGPWMSAPSLGLRWMTIDPNMRALTDPRLNDFWDAMYEEAAQKHPVDLQVIAQSIMTSLSALYHLPADGPQVVSRVASIVLPRISQTNIKLFPHLNQLLKDGKVSMDFCDCVLPFFSDEEKKLMANMVLNVPAHALASSAWVTQWVLEQSISQSSSEGRVKKM